MSMRCLWTDGSERYPRRRLGLAVEAPHARVGRWGVRRSGHTFPRLPTGMGRSFSQRRRGRPTAGATFHAWGWAGSTWGRQTNGHVLHECSEFSPKVTKEAVGIFPTIQHRANSVSNVGELTFHVVISHAPAFVQKTCWLDCGLRRPHGMELWNTWLELYKMSLIRNSFALPWLTRSAAWFVLNPPYHTCTASNRSLFFELDCQRLHNKSVVNHAWRCFRPHNMPCNVSEDASQSNRLNSKSALPSLDLDVHEGGDYRNLGKIRRDSLAGYACRNGPFVQFKLRMQDSETVFRYPHMRLADTGQRPAGQDRRLPRRTSRVRFVELPVKVIRWNTGLAPSRHQGTATCK
jgi:hypothetical protein